MNEHEPGILQWASTTDDSTVTLFWEKLREAVREPSTASPERVLSELRAYGGSTLRNVFRDPEEYVPYSDIVLEVAKAIRPNIVRRFLFAEKVIFPKDGSDIEIIEEYILEKMGILDDIHKLCAEVATAAHLAAGGTVAKIAVPAFAETLARVLGSSVTTKIGEMISEQITKHVAERVLEETAQRIAAETGKKVGSKAVQKAAEKAAQETAKRLAVQIAAQIAAALNVIFAALFLVQIDGPALRVTIPGVVFVAILRKLKCAWEHGTTFEVKT